MRQPKGSLKLFVILVFLQSWMHVGCTRPQPEDLGELRAEMDRILLEFDFLRSEPVTFLPGQPEADSLGPRVQWVYEARKPVDLVEFGTRILPQRLRMIGAELSEYPKTIDDFGSTFAGTPTFNIYLELGSFDVAIGNREGHSGQGDSLLQKWQFIVAPNYKSSSDQ